VLRAADGMVALPVSAALLADYCGVDHGNLQSLKFHRHRHVRQRIRFREKWRDVGRATRWASKKGPGSVLLAVSGAVGARHHRSCAHNPLARCWPTLECAQISKAPVAPLFTVNSPPVRSGSRSGGKVGPGRGSSRRSRGIACCAAHDGRPQLWAGRGRGLPQRRAPSKQPTREGLAA
jgi:hypothetical protein